jgi:heterotetrameric sarcosine oxidase delta subunit
MLKIECPYCGEREEHEFTYGGEAHILRPLADNRISDRQFGEYLFLRDNPKGIFLERWRHAAGCRRWFNIVRDTMTHEIIEIYPIDTLPKSKEGIAAYKESWRRNTIAEAAAKPAFSKSKMSRA